MTHKPFPYSGFILPSSESNFFDYNQSSPINQRYPSPSSFIASQYLISGVYLYSGIYATFPSGENLIVSEQETGIFHYDGLSGQFSNYSKFTGIKNNFQSFNTYIHYYPKNVEDLDDIDNNDMDKDYSLKIPYLSSYRINTFTYNPYRTLF